MKPTTPSDSLKSAAIFIALLAALLHLLFVNAQHTAPIRQVAVADPAMTRQLEQDRRFRDVASGSNLAMHFDGFDTATFADGSKVAYTYDAHENLTSAADASVTTTLTYDTNDRLTQITYPSGRYLKYTYDTAGNRTRLLDSGVPTTNTYNVANQLIRSQAAAGYTTNTYDGAGNLLKSLAPSNQRTMRARRQSAACGSGRPRNRPTPSATTDR